MNDEEMRKPLEGYVEFKLTEKDFQILESMKMDLNLMIGNLSQKRIYSGANLDVLLKEAKEAFIKNGYKNLYTMNHEEDPIDDEKIIKQKID